MSAQVHSSNRKAKSNKVEEKDFNVGWALPTSLNLKGDAVKPS
jgi:hypothetical protein